MIQLVKRTCENCRYFKKSNDKDKTILGYCWTDPPWPEIGRGLKVYSSDLGCRYWEAKV